MVCKVFVGDPREEEPHAFMARGHRRVDTLFRGSDERETNFEVTSNLEDPEHSLLNFSLAKVVSQNPVSGLVENREGVQAVGVPVAVICESTWNKKSLMKMLEAKMYLSLQ